MKQLGQNFAAVMGFALLGGAARLVLMKLLPSNGIWIANVVGSLLIGLLAGYVVTHTIKEWLAAGVKFGFLGTFTTFSSAMATVYNDISQGGTKAGVLYGFSSVAGCFAAAYLGLIVMTMIFPTPQSKEND